MIGLSYYNPTRDVPKDSSRIDQPFLAISPPVIRTAPMSFVSSKWMSDKK